MLIGGSHTMVCKMFLNLANPCFKDSWGWTNTGSLGPGSCEFGFAVPRSVQTFEFGCIIDD
jgi:hypothetical protein